MTTGPTTRDPAAILPCPFCGGEAAATNYVIDAAVSCGNCRATIKRTHPRDNDDGLPAAISAWNRRDAAQALLAEVTHTMKLAEDFATQAGTNRIRAERAERALAGAVGLLRDVREYAADALRCERANYEGHEHCSDIPRIEADLSSIDEYLAHHDGARTGESNGT